MHIRTFDNVHDFIEAVLGPQNADAHVLAWRRRQFRIAHNKWLDEADERVRAETDRIITDIRARRAHMLEAAE